MLIAYSLFPLDSSFKHSLLALTAAAVVEKPYKRNETSFYPIPLQFQNVVLHRGCCASESGVFVLCVMQRKRVL